MNRRLTSVLLVFLSISISMSVFVEVGLAWSNGGYSADPSNPDYGTHDWIAQHALDWLPDQEKQYIVNNLAAYLYGTELPDNGGAPDGIGDTTKHHIYYNSAEVMTDDAAAVRASTEYSNTLSYLEAKDYEKAAKDAGIMSHYIVDVAVFGHVMGSGTDWGAEVHHSDYETYVNGRTSSYSAEFNSYLSFDGSLITISAYDAASDLAYDNTFDVDGDLTCVWMDQNYDWSNSTFKSRAGESLNLAVNYLTDVLYTLYLEAASADSSPPSTVHDYDGSWRNTDFIVTLTATDDLSGVNQTYYKINDGTTKTVSADEQPLIATEGDNNKLEYWSVDNAGNVENIKTEVIKIDKTTPTMTITSPSPSYEIKSSNVSVTWTGSDEFSGISHYEIRLDGGSWTSVGTNTTYTFTGLSDGSHMVDIKAVDKAGNTNQDTVNFIINTSPLFGPGYIEEIAITASIILLALGITLYLFKIKKH